MARLVKPLSLIHSSAIIFLRKQRRFKPQRSHKVFGGLKPSLFLHEFEVWHYFRYIIFNMNPSELKKLEKELLEEKSKMERELGEIANKNPKIKGHYSVRFPEYGKSQDENALEVTDVDRAQAIEENLEKRLNDINQTLERIKKGTYGVCENCSSSIEEKRLNAMPVASLCISCAKKDVS